MYGRRSYISLQTHPAELDSNMYERRSYIYMDAVHTYGRHMGRVPPRQKLVNGLPVVTERRYHSN